MAEIFGFEQVVMPVAHLRRGEIYQRMGETGQAARHYRRFLEPWHNADSALQPLLEVARRRLSKVTEPS